MHGLAKSLILSHGDSGIEAQLHLISEYVGVGMIKMLGVHVPASGRAGEADRQTDRRTGGKVTDCARFD